MIRSKFFWLAAVLLAAIPLLVMDIPGHYVDWTREVHDEMIVTVHDQYKLLEANNSLMAKMYLKSFGAVVLLGLSIYFFISYRKQGLASLFKAAGLTFSLMLLTVGIKIFAWTSFGGSDKIKLLDLSPTDTTLTALHRAHFKGKVVYVDFWGTTCGPCLEEFRNFTKPLKAKYNNRSDIAYLYIAGGNKLLWKQQIQKLNVQGSHLFINQVEYARLYRSAVNGGRDIMVTMPRYLILDKTGKIVDSDAPRPSNKDSLIFELNKYLAKNILPIKSYNHE
jgi:thiol-disulfide isomerase/thioredoxin